MIKQFLSRLIIFIADFASDFFIPLDHILSLLQEILNYVESKGHIITFAFLPYVPAYSCDPRMKPVFDPQPDYTQYLVKLNDKIKFFADANPLQACFDHKRVGYNSKLNLYKGSHWLNYSSTAEPNFRFHSCHSYSQDALRSRSVNFYLHVNSFVTSIN